MQVESRLREFRLLAIVVLAISMAGSLYCLSAIVMVASLSGAPNYPLERAQWNEHFWGLGLLGFILVSCLCAWVLAKFRRRESNETQR